MSDALSSDPLSVLEVFDRLEVGPAKITAKRLIMPYTLHYKGKTYTTALRYTYAEPVFKPGDLDDLNLASMIGVQLAFNYGLFCKTIAFHGPFSAVDQRFIHAMIDNTSCEIYVKKFLEPNPFLTGGASNLPAIQKKRYTRSHIEFIPYDQIREKQSPNTWITDQNSYCVLSSGGKDSLLSYGLLNELGANIHPIFINESGRHWYTALNAYKHFAREVPNTAKVWTNCDRVFNWMLRHIPFIREDYATIRADEYPIRLWTVAVFLFGAMPLMKKYGIGNMVIGDEYDTTRVLRHRGITHYDGLYDQSRFFDDELTAYFIAKQWNVRQFSILRPLAEIMIQKILVKRYPKLQQHQVSCHATHLSNGRVYPCGNCEKCRRIVGILAAMDEDPRSCGYTEEQIRACLQALEAGSINQAGNDAGQLKYMLVTKKIIRHSQTQGFARENPATMKVRFDPLCSPLDHIPENILEPLLDIWRNYTSGTVMKEAGDWIVNSTEVSLSEDSHIP